MSALEYILGLSLGAMIGILLAMTLQIGKGVPLRFGVGLFVGFSAFLIALMVTTSIGDLYTNTAIASVLLSVMARNSWG